MYGKATAFLKGRGGSMHLCAPGCGFMGTSAIVASIMPVAVGATFANKRFGNGKIVAAFFGDGALDEGAFWESLNTACVMKIPILFVCEDNGLAVHTHTSKRQGYNSITDIVSNFNCHVFAEETTDVEIIYELTGKAIELIKTTSMPCFLHLKYYRYLEHVGVNKDFDAGYRSKDEFERWYKNDPIKLQRAKLVKSGFKSAEIKKLEAEIDAKIKISISKAKKAPFADESELCRGVF
jgi:TPP-dependent pyruvate/acetoin dehydrogenase alpha subunit